MAELCLGTMCLGSILVLVYLLGDIGVRKGYQMDAQRKYKSTYKSRKK
jgi:hypothetical protein